MLREKALYYYLDRSKSCCEAMILAAGEHFKLNITEEESFLFTGFRGGMGCGSSCGAMTGAIGAMGRLFQGDPLLTGYCSEFVRRFREGMECESIDCCVLQPKYKVPERRCASVVEKSADILEELVRQIQNGEFVPEVHH